MFLPLLFSAGVIKFLARVFALAGLSDWPHPVMFEFVNGLSMEFSYHNWINLREQMFSVRDWMR
jgi:hypothetical protein